MHIKLANVANNSISTLDQEIQLFQGNLSGFSVSWSNDSNYITYANSHENRNHQIIVYDIEKKKKHFITSAFYNDSNPVFSGDNKYIYCTTDRVFDPVYSDFDNSWIYPNATKIGIIPLTKDAEHPIELKNDEVSIKEDDKHEKASKEGKKKEDEKEDEKIKPVVIDFDAIESRMVILPVELGKHRKNKCCQG